MLIAFSGKAQSGKTTAANHLVSLVGGHKIALGDAVKEEVKAFINSMQLDCEPRHLYGTAQDREESLVVPLANWQRSDYRPRNVLNKYMVWPADTTLSITYRQLLQLWGTEYRRAQKESYWCDRAAEKISSTQGNVFIDDIRFSDEVEMIRSQGGVIIRLERPGGARIKESGHPSETALDDYKDFNVTVINGGSLEDFEDEIEKIARLVV